MDFFHVKKGVAEFVCDQTGFGRDPIIVCGRYGIRYWSYLISNYFNKSRKCRCSEDPRAKTLLNLVSCCAQMTEFVRASYLFFTSSTR